MSDLRRLSVLVGLRPLRLALAVLLGVVAVVAGAALLGVSGYLICEAARQPPILSLTVVMVTVRVLALVRPTARYGERLWSHDLAFRTLGHVRASVFSRLEPLAPGGIEQFRRGELLSRMVADVDELQDLVLRIVLPVAVAAVGGTVIVAAVAWMLPAAGLALVIGLLLAATIAPLVAYRTTSTSRRRQAELRAHLTAELVDTLSAAPELWLYHADEPAARAVHDADDALVRAALADSRGAGAAEAIGVVVSGATVVTVLALAAAAAGRGALDPLLVAPVTLVALGSFEAVLPLSISARHLPSVLTASRRVLELIGQEPEVVDGLEPYPPPGTDGVAIDIDLSQVVVGRGRGEQRVRVLDGIDVDLPSGDRIVVSGPSGAGKSTLLLLLARFLERQGGEAHLADRELRGYRQDDVRSSVLYVGQDPHVFNSTIRENVAFAKPGADDDEIIAALAQAQLGPWLASLPDGLDTPVGELGRTLSGGQRQRLAMARTFLADPAVVLLDEPTAHLDVENASALLGDLWGTAGDRSVILVTHGEAGPFAAGRELVLMPAQPGAGAASGESGAASDGDAAAGGSRAGANQAEAT
jgi:ATP-binding cassette subfamily C protein CydC